MQLNQSQESNYICRCDIECAGSERKEEEVNAGARQTKPTALFYLFVAVGEDGSGE